MSNELFRANAVDGGLYAEQAAFRLALRDFVDNEIPPVPEYKAPRAGIVVVGGGPYTCGVIVGLKLLRERGCTLPVEVWHLRGELTAADEADLKALGATTICAEVFSEWGSIARRDKFDGWRLKPFAIAYSEFRHVIFRDGDCYDVVDPTYLAGCPDYASTGVLLWPDLPWEDLTDETWRVFGVDASEEVNVPAVEAGQMVYDTVRNWKALQTTLYLNRRSDFTYRYVWGDKDTFAIGCRYTSTPYTIVSRRPKFVVHSLVHFAPGLDQPIPQTVHRARNKITFDAGQAAAFRHTEQYFTRFRFTPQLPREADVWRLTQEVRRSRLTTEEAAAVDDVESRQYYVVSVVGNRSGLIVFLPDGELGEGRELIPGAAGWKVVDVRLFVVDERGGPVAVLIRRPGFEPDGRWFGQGVKGNCPPLILRPLTPDAIRSSPAPSIERKMVKA